jgi:methylthioribose-1-phosphate isomerase
MTTPALDRLPRTIWLERVETRPVSPGATVGSSAPATGARSLHAAEVRLVDQTRLPMQGDILCCRTLEALECAIQSLAVRGAPALGVAGALALALWTANESTQESVAGYLAALKAAALRIASARPTAVNLKAAADEVVEEACRVAGKHPGAVSLDCLKERVIEHASSFVARDELHNRAIGDHGATLLGSRSRVLTLCNAGSLATAFYGTALGVVYTACAQGKVEKVWVCETRPVNQGSRLTAWELMTCGVPCTLIADNMAASVMAHGQVDAVLVGADRICANGDTANKIGTLQLAVLASHYDIPLYVCAPTSTIDAGLPDGSGVPIEERDPREVSGFTATGLIAPQDATQAAAFDALTASGSCELSLRGGQAMSIMRKGGTYAFDAWFASAPPGVSVYNPSFDVTPAALVSAIVTEEGVMRPPYHMDSHI